ncbi:MAG: hypothetical protein ACRDTX_20745 [Pseudonocardiaceae bacterium]
MLNNAAGARWRWRRRVVTVFGLGVATVVALAIPALAHPVFSNDAPGFPNPQGSTANPYPLGSRPTMNMFLPFEQDGVVFNGADNTTVDVKVTVPAGWTNPACGAVHASPSSAGYRQVSALVAGWTCTVEPADSHQVLHWHGPQVSAPHTWEDSAQFFTFQVTVPSPATLTSYGLPGRPEGFYVEQLYASHTAATCATTDNDCSLWRTPNSTRPGVVANGVVRTVAGSTAPAPGQTPEPESTENHQGPNHPNPNPPGATPTVANPPGAKPASPTPLPVKQGGGGPAPAPAGGPSPAGTPTAGGPPGATPQDSPTPSPADSSPGVDPQPASAGEQRLSQQRDDAAGRGVGWLTVVGAVLAIALMAGAVIMVVKRRRAS